MDRGSDEGVLTLRGALWAFSLEFEPLPGVDLPSGLRKGNGHDSDAAMSSILPHWSELSTAQRKIVASYLVEADGSGGPAPLGSEDPGPGPAPAASASTTPLGGGPGRSRPTWRAGTTEPATARALLASLATNALSAESLRLGHSVNALGLGPGSLFVHLAGKDKPGFPAYTEVSTGPLTTENDDTDPLPHDKTESASQCHIFFSPTIWGHADHVTSLTKREVAIVYHEVFHCYQILVTGHEHLYMADAMPLWVREGGAVWAAASMLDFEEPAWPAWLTSPEMTISKHSYDGFGLFFELDWLGREMWSKWWGIWDAASKKIWDTKGWFDAVVDSSAQSLRDSWGSSYLQAGSWGHAWTIEAGGIMHAFSAPVALDPDSAPEASVSPFSAFHGVVDEPTTSDVLVITSTSQVRVRDAHGAIHQVGATRIGVCLSSDDCKPCPKSSAASVFIGVAPLQVATAAFDQPVKVKVTTESRKEHCAKKDDPGRPGGGGGGGGGDAPPPHTPRALDNGDPHVRTVDGTNYDFQAAGEFVALDGGKGFLLQARHQMIGARSDVSAVTAVAMSVMGDRVTVSGTGANLVLRVDGAVAPIEAAHALPHGGRTEPEQHGVHVTWPDGSEVWVLPTQAERYGLNLLASIADDRVATAKGLLGPAPDGALRARDGKTITYATPSAGSRAYTDLYRTFGDSWRVTAHESLFDYGPGESIATFDLRQYPDGATTIEALSPADRARGEAACARVRDAALRKDCILDVGLTGDTAQAAGYDVVDAVVSSRGDLSPGDVVRPTRIEPETAHTYRIRVDRPTTVYFRHDSADEVTGGDVVTWSLTNPDGEARAAVSIEEDFGRIEMGPGVYQLRVETPKGASATYGFALLETAPDQRFEIERGSVVRKGRPGPGAAELANWGDRDLYTFDAHAGDHVAFTGVGCGATPQSIGGALYRGAEVTEASRIGYVSLSCGGSPTAFDLPADGTYTFAVTAEAVGIYYYDAEPPEGKSLDGAYGFEFR